MLGRLLLAGLLVVPGACAVQDTGLGASAEAEPVPRPTPPGTLSDAAMEPRPFDGPNAARLDAGSAADRPAGADAPLEGAADATRPTDVQVADAPAPSFDSAPPDSAPLPPDASPLVPGLVAHWKLDEAPGRNSAADSSGNGNEAGLFMLDALKVWLPGRVGGGIQVLGANRAVIAKASPSLATIATAFTISAWIKKDMPRGGMYRTIVSRQLGSGAEKLFSFGFFDGRLQISGARIGELRAVGDPVPLLPDWGHVCATHDGAVLRLFLNGAEIATRATTGTVGPGTTPVVIGGQHNDATGAITQPMDGFIDDLRLYSRALSLAEIRALAMP